MATLEPRRRPAEHARRPPFHLPTYAVRAPLARWLRAEADRLAATGQRVRILDVGSGVRPYEPFFLPAASEYVSVDLDHPAADLQGTVEEIPVQDGSFDLVLCNQVLEHCDDPRRAVAELRRVLAPSGQVLASTHGVQVYHPAPHDLWRWTHAGLERLFADNADWKRVTVRPSSGTTACLGMLLSIYVEHAARRARLDAVGRVVTAAVNRAAERIDSRSALLSSTAPGTIHANYHVVAEA